MRKKEPERRDSRDPPLRRSMRLQQEKAEDQVSQEPTNSTEQYFDDILTPRQSIRAHRKQHKVALAEEEPPPTAARAPLPPPKAEPPKEPKRTPLETDTHLSPFVKLRRLDVAQDEEPSPPKELPKPSGDWEVAKDRREHLQDLTASEPQSTLVQRLVGKAKPNLQEKAATEAASQRQRQATEELTSRLKHLTMKTVPEPSTSAAKAGAKKQSKYWKRPPALGLLLFLLLVALTGWILWGNRSPDSGLGLSSYLWWGWNSISRWWHGTDPCSSQCRLVLVESIPETLEYESLNPQNPRIYQAWMQLLAEANSSVEIAAFYFTLRDSDIQVEDPSSRQGREVFEALKELPERGVKLSIAVNSPTFSDNDTRELAQHGADVWYVDMKRLTGGILHTKLWVVDQKHIFIGSANMDWRSLTQVKELGAVIYNCSCLARDLHRIFDIYRLLGEDASIPTAWHSDLDAKSSLTRPLDVDLDGAEARIYISSSPPPLCSTGRTPDLTAVLSTIQDARDFVYIAVMDYEPQCVFCRPKRFWPVIDDALRAAACDRHVNVRLLISCWPHSRHEMFVFLESLKVLSYAHCPIDVKLFVVPPGEEVPPIPYSHVNHNKYMVTDRLAYIGTSNWSEDYFVRTAGVGLVVNQSDLAPESLAPSLRQQLEDVFLRDWTSPYALPLASHPQCARR